MTNGEEVVQAALIVLGVLVFCIVAVVLMTLLMIVGYLT